MHPTLPTLYPILNAHVKSRFTCPMCRTYLQHTKQSRRAKKLHNKRSRGEELNLSARGRRGGQGRRKRQRAENGLKSEETGPSVEIDCAMPSVTRNEAVEDS